MNDEQNPNGPQIGLYRDPSSGQFIGALDQNQAAAFVRVGFSLFEAGRDAAMTTQDELDALTPEPEPETQEAAPSSSKKGAK